MDIFTSRTARPVGGLRREPSQGLWTASRTTSRTRRGDTSHDAFQRSAPLLVASVGRWP